MILIIRPHEKITLQAVTINNKIANKINISVNKKGIIKIIEL